MREVMRNKRGNRFIVLAWRLQVRIVNLPIVSLCCPGKQCPSPTAGWLRLKRGTQHNCQRQSFLTILKSAQLPHEAAKTGEASAQAVGCVSRSYGLLFHHLRQGALGYGGEGAGHLLCGKIPT